MKNSDQWRASKFIWKNGKLLGSRNRSELQVSSRFVADIVAAFYQRYLPLYARGDLIDLGCGKVPLYDLYKDYVSSITCVDWQNSLHKNPFLDQTCDLTKTLPFPDGTFDTILLSDVLEHVPRPGHLWKEMSRILKTGGTIILNVPFYYKLHETPHDFYRYTEFGLRRFAEKNSLTIELLASIGGIPEVVCDLFAKLFYRLPAVGNTVTIILQSMCKRFITTSIGKSISDKTSGQFPLGYFMVVRKNGSPTFHFQAKT